MFMYVRNLVLLAVGSVIGVTATSLYVPEVQAGNAEGSLVNACIPKADPDALYFISCGGIY